MTEAIDNALKSSNTELAVVLEELNTELTELGAELTKHKESDLSMYKVMQDNFDYQMSQQNALIQQLIAGGTIEVPVPTEPNVDTANSVNITNLCNKPLLGSQKVYVAPSNGVIYGNSLVPLLASLLTSVPTVNVNNVAVFSPDRGVLESVLGQYVTMPNISVKMGDKITQSNMTSIYFAPYKQA